MSFIGTVRVGAVRTLSRPVLRQSTVRRQRALTLLLVVTIYHRSPPFGGLAPVLWWALMPEPTMTPDEEHEFYSRPDNQEPQGHRDGVAIV